MYTKKTKNILSALLMLVTVTLAVQVALILPGCNQPPAPPPLVVIDPPFEPMPQFPPAEVLPPVVNPTPTPQPPPIVVPPSPNAPVEVPTETPAPSVPGQAVWPNMTTVAERGISVRLEVDSNSPDRAGRVYWKTTASVCADCYFVGLDARGQSIVIDFMSRGKSSGECDVFRVDVERVVKWATRPSQY